MMDGEDVYRARLEACLAAAAASPLPQVRDRHLSAAKRWRELLQGALERKTGASSLKQETGTVEAEAMIDVKIEVSDFDIADPVVDAIKQGMPAIKAFRQSSGQSQHDVAVEAGMTDERLAEIESGRTTATAAETAEISEVLHVPEDLLVNK